MALTVTAALMLRYVQLLDSSSDEDSTDEEDENVLLCLKNKCLIPRARCKNYMEIVASFTDHEFKQHFRLVNYENTKNIYFTYQCTENLLKYLFFILV